MKKSTLIFLTFFVFYSSNLIGQVAIGTGEAPNLGILLQIQNLPINSSNNINANKGMILPRVELTDLNNLFPMFLIGYSKTEQDPIHTGLTVFNTNNNLTDGDGRGIYTWNGKKWIKAGFPF